MEFKNKFHLKKKNQRYSVSETEYQKQILTGWRHKVKLVVHQSKRDDNLRELSLSTNSTWKK